MSDNRHFYANLDACGQFDEALETERHVPLPEDWWILIADVVNSTQAIAAGAYKAVNSVGVACIAAISNVDRDIELPCLFGGDGATLAIPGSLRDAVIQALRGCQQLARDQFDLTLRAGLVPVQGLIEEGYWLRIGKVRLSRHITLPVLSGRGWEEAERRVKAGKGRGALWVAPDDGPAAADFTGFECRWRSVPSFRDHKVALIVVATHPDPSENLATYREVMQAIERIFGDVRDHHPLRPDALQLSLSLKDLQHELRVRHGEQGRLGQLRQLAKLLFLSLAGRYLFWRQRDTDQVRWSAYRDDLVAHTDFRKFDGALRMVIDASASQIEALERDLMAWRQAGRLAYGLHRAPAALVTCLVRSYNDQHLHFVDGSDGGYALAARQLKQQLSERRGTPPNRTMPIG